MSLSVTQSDVDRVAKLSGSDFAVVDRRARLRAMAEAIPLLREWECAMQALEAGDPSPILALPVWERAFLEDEIPGVAEVRERLAPASWF